MTVVQISATADRRGRCPVTFSDGTVMKLPVSVIGDFGLCTGLALDEAQMDALMHAARMAEAKHRAMNILSVTTVSARDLSERLQHKGATEDEAAQTVEWLGELNLLDDARTAQQIVQRGVRRGYGKRRIQQMLYEKKIPRAYWEAALAQMPPMDDALDDYLRAHLQGEVGEKERKRTVDALLRRGFTWSEIKDGLRRLDCALADAMEDE